MATRPFLETKIEMAPSLHVLMIFLDGVGIGKKDPATNPFFTTTLPAIRSLCGGTLPYHSQPRIHHTQCSVIPVNATLGIAGLPQSGTGQTTLMTGMNAARIVGKHFGPYPYSTLRPMLQEENIFVRLQRGGKKPYFVNAFPSKYFDYYTTRMSRLSTLSSAWLSTGKPLHTHEDLASGKALSADITSEEWNKMGFPPVPEISIAEAGKRLCRFTRDHHFVLYEYYLTDHAGHSRSMKEAVDVLGNVDALIAAIVEHFNFRDHLLIITSDHGNLEDLSTKSHTRNPVPLIVAGRGHKEIARRVRSLAHITPILLEMICS